MWPEILAGGKDAPANPMLLQSSPEEAQSNLAARRDHHSEGALRRCPSPEGEA